MNQKDIEFFEAYKRLDVLCRDVLNCKNGVSEYIQQMGGIPSGIWEGYWMVRRLQNAETYPLGQKSSSP